MNRIAPILAAILALAPLACADAPSVIKLWPGEIPGPAAKTTGPEQDFTKPDDKLIAGRRIIKLGNVATPEMHVFLPPAEKANGAAVAICPGGGFHILAWDLEGTEVAGWLNSIGIAAFVVKYRVPTGAHGDALNDAGTAPQKALGPLMDAQRALSLVRAHAADWKLDVKRIGILGFSAGGETAGLAALAGDQRAYAKIDASDEQPCAPDFAVLIYPAGFVDSKTGAPKPHIRAGKKSPPTFLAITQDDPVNCENATTLFTALKRAGVPAELHIFPTGGHGYGLRPTADPVTHWPRLVEQWLTGQKLIAPVRP